MAILDTGASRSVIGAECVPMVTQKLPLNIRSKVKERPSQVGFRFGNNQVAYSFKQIQIPLVHQKSRIWLLIEVVPKATPFLLSIKAMKSLGAVIDLSTNSCFLKTLNRSLPLHENRNGLFVIDVADLRHAPKDQPPRHVAFAVPRSELSIPPAPGFEPLTPLSHADPSRAPDRLAEHRGRDHPDPEVSPDTGVLNDHSPGPRGECDRGSVGAGDATGSGSVIPTPEDRGAVPDHWIAVCTETHDGAREPFDNEPSQESTPQEVIDMLEVDSNLSWHLADYARWTGLQRSTPRRSTSFQHSGPKYFQSEAYQEAEPSTSVASAESFSGNGLQPESQCSSSTRSDPQDSRRGSAADVDTSRGARSTKENPTTKCTPSTLDT